MKKLFLSLALGIVLLLVFLLAFAPAKSVIPYVLDKLPSHAEQIQVSGVSGSIWSPQIEYLSIKQFQIRDVSLDIEVLSLFMAKLSANLRISDPDVKLNTQFRASEKSLQLVDMDFRLAAQKLNPYMSFPVTGLSGEFAGTIEQMVLSSDKKIETLTGEGHWIDGQIDYLNQQQPMGNIRYQLSAVEDGALKLNIIENQGPLDLKGTLIVAPNKNYQLQLHAQQQLPENIAAWVERFARLENGRYHLNWKGQLP